MTKTLVQQFIAHLKAKGIVQNQKDFALKIGYGSESAFSQALKKNPIPEETFEKIKILYPEFMLFSKKEKLPLNNSKQESIFNELPIEEKLNIINEKIDNKSTAIIAGQDWQEKDYKILSNRIEEQEKIIKKQNSELLEIKKLLQKILNHKGFNS